jgi:hypothetical protein
MRSPFPCPDRRAGPTIPTDLAMLPDANILPTHVLPCGIPSDSLLPPEGAHWVILQHSNDTTPIKARSTTCRCRGLQTIIVLITNCVSVDAEWTVHRQV